MIPDVEHPYEGDSLTARPDNVCAGNYYPVPTFVGSGEHTVVRHPEEVIIWARELYMAVYDGSPSKVAQHLLTGDGEHDAYPWLGRQPHRAVKMWAENGTTTNGVPWKVEMANALKVMAPSTQAKTALTIVQKAQDAPQVLWEVMNDVSARAQDRVKAAEVLLNTAGHMPYQAKDKTFAPVQTDVEFGNALLGQGSDDSKIKSLESFLNQAPIITSAPEMPEPDPRDLDIIDVDDDGNVIEEVYVEDD